MSPVGLCPGTKISGGKVLSARTRRSTNRVRQALKLVVMSHSRNRSALGAFYRRLCARMDKPCAADLGFTITPATVAAP